MAVNRKRRARPRLEALESRDLLAGVVGLNAVTGLLEMNFFIDFTTISVDDHEIATTLTATAAGDISITEVRGDLGLAKAESTGGGSIDLDASILAFSGNTLVETVFYGNLSNSNKSILHEGDNLTGDGDGDDEVIHIDLNGLPQNIDGLVVAVTSYSRHQFSRLSNAFIRVLDDETNTELARYELSKGDPSLADNTALLAGKVKRVGGAWNFTALGTPANGRVPRDVVQVSTAQL